MHDRDPAGAFLGSVLADQLAQVRANAASFAEAHEEEALHQLRISVRKVRALTSFLTPLARTDAVISGANDELRELAAPFGELRDLDVLILAIDDEEAPVVAADGRALRRALVRRRDEAAHASTARLASRPWRRELDALDAAAARGPWLAGIGARDDARLVVGHELDTWWWAIGARWAGLAALSERRRHRVRIGAKKLRYLTELTASLFTEWSGEQAETTRAFKALQDELGALQDHVAAVAMIRSHGYRATPADPAATAAHLGRAQAEIAALESRPPFWRSGATAVL